METGTHCFLYCVPTDDGDRYTALYGVCVCVCVCVCVSVIISLCSGLFLCTVMQYIGFVGVLFSA